MPRTLTFPIRSDRLTQSVRVERDLLVHQSEFQKIEIVETAAFGRAMLLDGHIQLTELDEHVYHEALVQVPLLNMDSPTRALVVGGGDGGVLRELVKHPGLKQIDMVEIDRAVVDASLKVWPELSAGAFEDPRVNLQIADAFGFVKNATEPYDLIVVDSTDVYEEEDQSLSEMLFTPDFYRDLARLLTDQGVVVTQADNLVFCPYSLEGILEIFRPIFPRTGHYFAVIPSFGGFSGFAWGSRGGTVRSHWSDLTPPSIPLRYLNPTAYDYGMAPLNLVSAGT